MPFATQLGGAERLLRVFAERARRVDVEPRLIFFEHGDLERSLAAAGLVATVVEPGRFRSARSQASAFFTLARLIREERPDVVLSWTTRAHVVLAPAAVAAGARRRLAWYRHTVHEGGGIERAATALPAAAVIANSEAAMAAQKALRPRRRVELAEPGIDAPEVRSREEVDRLRVRLGIPATRLVVGISGRLVRWKGHDRFLAAVSELVRAGHDVHALVVGGSGHGLDPGYDRDLRAGARELGIEARVTLTGHVDDPFLHTQLMDVAVNASEVEPFGMALLEAMALERPVVAVDAGGPASFIVSGRTGVLVPSASPDALARAVGDLLSDPQERAAIGAAARRQVIERHTTERWLADVRAALESVADPLVTGSAGWTGRRRR